MRTIISFAIASALALSALAGCSTQSEKPSQPADAGQTAVVGQESSENTQNDQPQIGGKMMINFEGRVTEMGEGSVTLDTGKTVLIGDETAVMNPDWSAAELAVGDYIQGYAADPDAAQLEAVRILVTPL